MKADWIEDYVADNVDLVWTTARKTIPALMPLFEALKVMLKTKLKDPDK